MSWRKLLQLYKNFKFEDSGITRLYFSIGSLLTQHFIMIIFKYTKVRSIQWTPMYLPPRFYLDCWAIALSVLDYFFLTHLSVDQLFFNPMLLWIYHEPREKRWGWTLAPIVVSSAAHHQGLSMHRWRHSQHPTEANKSKNTQVVKPLQGLERVPRDLEALALFRRSHPGRPRPVRPSSHSKEPVRTTPELLFKPFFFLIEV